MALPDTMLGSFLMDTSEGFDEFMYEMGVNIFTRKVANNLYPQQDIHLEDDEISIVTLTSFRNIKTRFRLGEAWEENTPDGRTTQTVATLEGSSIVKVRGRAGAGSLWQRDSRAAV
jgi:hypothetical protein